MSIKEIARRKTTITALFIFLITLLAFGLGYLTGHDANRVPIVIEKTMPFELSENPE
ncbi:hypothetical protein KKH05_01290 [Patescibacteria group bacterium]|nr:hypothetical protein [Patescibacteria group bacterium]